MNAAWALAAPTLRGASPYVLAADTDGAAHFENDDDLVAVVGAVHACAPWATDYFENPSDVTVSFFFGGRECAGFAVIQVDTVQSVGTSGTDDGRRVHVAAFARRMRDQ